MHINEFGQFDENWYRDEDDMEELQYNYEIDENGNLIEIYIWDRRGDGIGLNYIPPETCKLKYLKILFVFTPQDLSLNDEAQKFIHNSSLFKE